jgi:hypothetical protein
MNIRRCDEGDRLKAAADIERYRDPANDPSLSEFRPATPLVAPFTEHERRDLLRDIDYLRAEVRHLKKALQTTIAERDILRAAHRVISVTAASRRAKAGERTRSAADKRRRDPSNMR